jgi:hypothetical protein
MARNPSRLGLTVFAVVVLEVVLEVVVFGLITFGVTIFGVTTFGVTVRLGVTTRFVVRVFWVPSCFDVTVLELDVSRGVLVVRGGALVLGAIVLGAIVLGATVLGAAAFLPAV